MALFPVNIEGGVIELWASDQPPPEPPNGRAYLYMDGDGVIRIRATTGDVTRDSEPVATPGVEAAQPPSG